jgi:hypothetical protein
MDETSSKSAAEQQARYLQAFQLAAYLIKQLLTVHAVMT